MNIDKYIIYVIPDETYGQKYNFEISMMLSYINTEKLSKILKGYFIFIG